MLVGLFSATNFPNEDKGIDELSVEIIIESKMLKSFMMFDLRRISLALLANIVLVIIEPKIFLLI
jgi:hypothetical protein